MSFALGEFLAWFPLPGPWGAFAGRLHPLTVHFPIAFLLAAAVLELGRALARRPPSPLARGFLLAGALSAVLAALLGLQLAADPSAPRGGALDLHRWAGIGTAVLAPLAWLLALASRRGEPALVQLARVVLFIAALLLVLAAHLGASLSHGRDWLTEPFRRDPAAARPEPGALAGGAASPDADAEGAGALAGRRAAAPAGRPVEAAPSTAAGAEGAGGAGAGAPAAGGGREGAAELVERVRGLLAARCERCHGEERAKAGLRLSRLEQVVGPDPSWAVVVPGDPGRSALLRRVRLPADHEDRMPPEGPPLSAAETARIEAWIRAGAPLQPLGTPESGSPPGSPAPSTAAEPPPPAGGPPPSPAGRGGASGGGGEDAGAGGSAAAAPPASPPLGGAAGPAAPGDPDGLALFEQRIAPLLEARCLKCHGPRKAKGGLRLDLAERATRVDRGLAAIVPGDPARSEALRRVSLPAVEEDAMPPEGPRLSQGEREALRAWIVAGAPWPQGRVLAPEEHDASQDTERAALPGVPPGPLPESVRARLAALVRRGVRAAPVALDSGGIEISLAALGERAGDAELAELGDLLPRTVRLDLSGTGVSDAGLAALEDCTALTHLRLGETGIGDEGLARLAHLPRLEVLVLVGTAVSDEGLASLAAAPALRRVYVWRTAVSEAGARALAAAHPQVEVIGALGRRLGKREDESPDPADR